MDKKMLGFKTTSMPVITKNDKGVNSLLNLRRPPLLAVVILMLVLLTDRHAIAQSYGDKNRVVRVAMIMIDSMQLANYNAALKEEIETSVRVEPGVLMLYAVADKVKPTHITILEIYANPEAFQSHLQTPHFKKYKTTTKEMVKHLQLMEASPIALEAKSKL